MSAVGATEAAGQGAQSGQRVDGHGPRGHREVGQLGPQGGEDLGRVAGSTSGRRTIAPMPRRSLEGDVHWLHG